MSHVKKKLVVEKAWTQGECLAALGRKYTAPEYALLPQVRDATGYAAKRSADAVVVSLYPSRGLTISGFEIKSSRSDWKRELEQPAKGEAIARFCDHWWVVTGSEKVITDVNEIPSTWGWLSRVDGELKILKPAALMKPEPLNIQFLAALLRRVAEWVPGKEQLEVERRRIRKECEDKYQDWVAFETKRNEKDKRNLAPAVAKFEDLTGIKLGAWCDVEAEAKNFFTAYIFTKQMAQHRTTAEQLRDRLRERVKDLDALLVEMATTEEKP